MIPDKAPPAFNLPYNQSASYYFAVFCVGENPALHRELLAQGVSFYPALCSVYMKRLENPWYASWKALAGLLETHERESHIEVALIPGDSAPLADELAFARKPLKTLDALAESLWLGRAMLEDRVVCYMQPVLDKRGKIFGYEAFARVETNEDPIGGGKIIEASRGLQVEYMLDRHLHVKAIDSFISSDLEGFLFINFVPGFIHRPEKYLEGLTESAIYNGMPARRIVLDFTQSETPRDLSQLKSIFDYCRSKGYSLSLDDISSIAMAKKILETIRPDFIKLDIDLVKSALSNPEQRVIEELVVMAHDCGATVLAEGVESENIHRDLLKSGVDLFQGYLFSPPVAVTSLKKAVG